MNTNKKGKRQEGNQTIACAGALCKCRQPIINLQFIQKGLPPVKPAAVILKHLVAGELRAEHGSSRSEA